MSTKKQYWARKNAYLCVHCGLRPPDRGPLCDRCRKLRDATRRRRNARRKAAGMCVECGSRPPEPGSQLCSLCHPGRNAAIRRTRLKTKLEVIEHYGGKCACCGEDELSFLTLDHINGGGSKHRKSVGGGKDFYVAMKRQGYPDGLQVLCANCHLSKTVLGQCIHKQGEIK